MSTNRFIILALFSVASVQAQISQPKPQSIHVEGIENAFKLSDSVYSGSAPENAAAFAELQKLGIKTIITVDGAKPDVSTAEKFGLRYVHLPFGYDGIPTNRALVLVKAARELPKPIYVHCHHGMHRGPAGAAIICQGLESWASQQAIDWLKQAGTATNYSGLYKSVEDFRTPSDAVLKKIPANFPATMEVSSLVDTMVEIDHRFDNLKLARRAGFQPSPEHPDINPAHEALLLEELFKEWNRSSESKNRGLDFHDAMLTAEKRAGEFRGALGSTANHLRNADNARLSAAFDTLTKTCASCHRTHRNQ